MNRILLLLFSVFVIVGCGIKPSSVEPPEDSNGTPYPATYPNPNTDP